MPPRSGPCARVEVQCPGTRTGRISVESCEKSSESATLSAKHPLSLVFAIVDCNRICIYIGTVGGHLGDRLGPGVTERGEVMARYCGGFHVWAARGTTHSRAKSVRSTNGYVDRTEEHGNERASPALRSSQRQEACIPAGERGKQWLIFVLNSFLPIQSWPNLFSAHERCGYRRECS